MRAVGLAMAAVALSIWLGVGLASADPIPFFYLVPTGPGTVPTVVPVGTTTYQLWGDPTGVTTPAGCLQPINGGCNGVLDILNLFFFPPTPSNALTITGFTPGLAAGTQFTNYCYGNFGCGVLVDTGSGSGNFPGEDVPFEIGTMTINNNGNGPGHIDLYPCCNIGYTDTNFNNYPITTSQTIAVAAPIPEPSTLLLAATGVVGLAVNRHRARGASLGERASP